MNLPAVYNTKERGRFYFIIFKEKEDFIAVCLNLNIIEYGKSPEKLKNSIEEAAQSHLKTIREKNLSDDNLNIPADKKYFDLLKQTINVMSEKPSKKITQVKRNTNTQIHTLLKEYSHHNNLSC